MYLTRSRRCCLNIAARMFFIHARRTVVYVSDGTNVGHRLCASEISQRLSVFFLVRKVHLITRKDVSINKIKEFQNFLPVVHKGVGLSWEPPPRGGEWEEVGGGGWFSTS